ncbi:hypothetical protein M413DRAFT_422530 [Hebeloma cylindrosporum]|uniref:Uncharacterized protein n=1 Tax=Hebeloma cylindrosporum TaxID=76867 RepID=A0A0C3CDV4_HEBCY|nr:hypothetical protein M413DRAFT_422530 [Hebeloma cylindrosporum h7]
MYKLSRAGSLVLFTLVLHSFLFFFASAAPVSVPSPTLPSHNSYAIDKPIHQSLSASLSRGGSRSALRSLVQPEGEALVRRSAASKIRGAFKKAGSRIKHAARKVGHFMKTTGAKIVKFGLKIASTAQSIGAKVLGFIPGLKPLGKAMKAASMATNAISNRIHVSLGRKLDKGMRVMDKIRNPVGGAGGKALNALLRREEDEWVFGRELDDLLWDREFDEDDIYSRDYEILQLLE